MSNPEIGLGLVGVCARGFMPLEREAGT